MIHSLAQVLKEETREDQKHRSISGANRRFKKKRNGA
jgi:hypothetical protein